MLSLPLPSGLVDAIHLYHSPGRQWERGGGNVAVGTQSPRVLSSAA
jgi:hypothetical protein